MSWKSGVNLQAVAERAARAAEAGAEAAAEVVFAESQDDVPVDTGDLKRSGKIERDGPRRRIRYTDEVAIIVHENLSVQHRVGSAKFLEKAMHTKRPDAAAAAAAETRRQLGT